MLSVVANVDDIVFDVEAALSQQLGTQPLPFPGMDSKYNFDVSLPCFVCIMFNNDFH